MREADREGKREPQVGPELYIAVLIGCVAVFVAVPTATGIGTSTDRLIYILSFSFLGGFISGAVFCRWIGHRKGFVTTLLLSGPMLALGSVIAGTFVFPVFGTVLAPLFAFLGWPSAICIWVGRTVCQEQRWSNVAPLGVLMLVLLSGLVHVAARRLRRHYEATREH